jgi:hypothetical protein
MASQKKDWSKYDKTSVLQRSARAYFPPALNDMFSAYAKANEMKKSEALKVIVRDFFHRMPVPERERIVAQSKNKY